MKKSFLVALMVLFASVLNATHWQPVSYGTSSQTATIIGVIEFEGLEQMSNQLEIGAFYGTICRGAGMSSVQALGRHYVFLTVYGNNGEVDSFKIYDHATQTELDMTCSQTYTYHDDDMIGSLPSPYVFSFIFNHFDINVSADPTAGGTVTGGGTYDRDATVTLKATANYGYSFTKWTKNGEQVSTVTPYSFTATMNTMGDYVAHFTPTPYEITATANPTSGGTVTGGGTHVYGSNVTLNANPATGYHFVNWTKDGNPVSTNTSYSFVVNDNASYVANFELNSYNITVSANPTAGGTVNGAGSYNHFATCTLTATPSIGYHFVSWKKNGSVVSTSATYTFEVNEGGSYVANFELNSYLISATANPTAGGTITGANTYNHFATCTLKATPATGYHFVNWTKGGEVYSTNTTISFQVTQAESFVANFEINSYAIGATANNSLFGSVAGAGTYNHFASCTLTATPATGYHFVNWTNGSTVVSTSATYTFEVSGAGDYIANFAINTYAITAVANPTAGGTVTGANTYEHFATCTLTATPATGYHFVKWTKGGVDYSTEPTISFEVSQAESYVANFEINSYAIGATANNALFGTVNGAGTYEHFSTCTLTATPATGYHFVNWTKGGTVVSTSAIYAFEVSGAGDYVANFAINTYEITAVANPTAGGTVTGANTYEHFATCTLVATPATGYHFVNWTKGGTEVSTSATYAFEVSGTGEYVANFAINTYAISAVANPTSGGSVTGADTYEHFATCTLVATPSTGYHFVNWTKGGVEYSINQTISFEVSQAESFVANFAINTYAIAVSSNITAGGNVTGGGTYEHFATCTLTATPAIGYHFVNWTKGGVEVSTSATYQFEVSGAGNYVANFAINSYSITVVANPTDGGTVTGSGVYNHFTTCTLVAAPATGYHFVNWTKDGLEYSTELTINFEVTQAESFVANFEINSYEIVATANNAQFGTVTGAGTYNHFETCTLVATPATGYHFVNWTKGGVEYSTNTTISFEVTQTESFVANFAINTYQITAVANPTAGGTVTGANTYEHFATCTLTATPATGYHFVNWTKGGEDYSTELTISFEVTQAESFIANFEINSYEIVATANNAQFGTVTGAGTYNHFETCTLVATPSTGYHFVNWTKGGVEYSTNATISFEVTQAETFVANFAINTYQITASVNPADGGTVTGAGTYNYGSTCTLTATPSDVYLFVNWTKNGTVVSTEPTISFTVFNNENYVANFIYNNYEITAYASPEYGGTVTGAGVYFHNQPCTLTATPATGYHFVNWTCNGAVVSTELVYTFTVTSSAEYVANFSPNVYQVTLFGTPAAAVSSLTGSGTYYYGQTCVIEAVPNEGYDFVHWKMNDDEIVSTTPSYSFNVIENVSFVAYFALRNYDITATANPAEGGTVNGAGTYAHGTSCTLSATPAEGYFFVNWTLNGNEVSTNTSYTFTVTEAADYVANFSINTYEITAVADPTEGGTVEGAGNFDHGSTCTLTTTPNTDYNFVNWTKDGIVVSEDTSYTFIVTDDGNYVAHFVQEIYYSVVVSVNPAEGGTVSGDGVFSSGDICTLTITPNTHYIFLNWTENGQVISTEATFSFTVDENHEIVANLEYYDGVGEDMANVIVIYPNPARYTLMIESHETIDRCDIYNVSGMHVMSQDANSNAFVVDVEDLRAGSYIIRLTTGKTIQTLRFIKY